MLKHIAPDLQHLVRPVSSFNFDEDNVLVHADIDIQATAASLKEHGQLEPIVVNARQNNRVLNGNSRLRGALEILGWTEIAAVIIDVDPEEADKIAVDLNATGRNPAAIWNDDVLRKRLDAAKARGLEIHGLGVDKLAELRGRLEDKAGKDTEAQIDRAAELQEKWGTALGQVWQLGEHRLACGDCTDKAVVEAVMQGERAEMVWTDPPYGVSVGDKNKFLNSIAPSNRVEENLQNDTLEEPELLKMLCVSFDNALSVCLAGGAWYVAAPPGPLHVLFGQALKDRGIWRQTIQWVKNNATFSPMGVDYHWQAEPIFYGWKPGAGHRYYGGRAQTTVWNIDRPMASPEHPTMKPVELIERGVSNSSASGEIVFDPFSGSGTTIIACQSLSRRARAIEVTPGYVAVALERWQAHTQQEPVLLK